MKNKKLLVTIASVLILSVLLIVFAGCKPQAKSELQLIEDYLKDAYSLAGYDKQPENVTKEITCLKDWTYMSSTNTFVLAYKTTDGETPVTEYALIDPIADKVIATSPNEFNLVSRMNVAYTETAEGKTSFYSVKGLIVTVDYYDLDADSMLDTAISIPGDKMIVENPLKGEIVIVDSYPTLSIPVEIVGDYFPKLSNGNYFLPYSSTTIAIFDKDGKLADIIDINNIILTPDGIEKETFVLYDGRIIYQYVTELPQDAEEYDFMAVNGYADYKKYDLVQYEYNLNTSALTEKSYGKVFSSIAPASYDGSLVDITYQEIMSNKTLSKSISMLADNNFKQKFDFDQYLYGSSPELVGEYLILQNSEYRKVFKDGKQVAFYSREGLADAGNGLYVKDNIYYNILGEKVFELTDDMSLVSSVRVENKIVYTMDELGENGEATGNKILYVFDSTTMKSTSLGIQNTECSVFGGDFYLKKNADGNITDMYAFEDNMAIFTGKTFTAVNPVDGLIRATDSEGNYSYFIYTQVVK